MILAVGWAVAIDGVKGDDGGGIPGYGCGS